MDPVASSGAVNTSVSSDNSSNPNGGGQVLFFRNVSLGLSESKLRFRLIHSWEARNPYTKVLIGQEMLLIDEEGTAIQEQYPVADHIAIVTFTWNTDLSVLDDPPVRIPEDRFRFRSLDEFRANCDSKGGLYDYVGHIRLLNGQTLTDHTVLDEVDITEKRHLCVHAQAHEDQRLSSIYGIKWLRSSVRNSNLMDALQRLIAPIHLILTGTLALTSMSSSRVFMDEDVQPSKDYFDWLSSNSDIANRVAADVVTKPEAATLEEIFFYIKQQGSKVAWFECTATIDDIVQSSAWYYISCGGCNSKAVKGPTSLICNNKKCERSEVTGVAQYLTKISVYDKSEQAVFVILGDAGKELTGKHAAELVANYYEANEGVGANIGVPVPQALLDTIGQTLDWGPATSDGGQSTGGEVSGHSSGSGVSAGKRAINTDGILASDATKPRNSNGIKEAINTVRQPPRQGAVTTAQPATSISTQESSTSRVTNVDDLARAESNRGIRLGTTTSSTGKGSWAKGSPLKHASDLLML
ncbi:hypothetical protein Bca101_065113 [Brassica carinata]